jgi:hypothetical protein
VGELNASMPSRTTVLRHRLVLLALAIPFIGIGVVLWLLLPGGAAAPAYSTTVFRHNAVLKPDYWPSRNVTVRGYLEPVRCVIAGCEPMALVSVPIRTMSLSGNALPQDAVLVAPQTESGWHGALRRLVPSLLKAPMTKVNRPGVWTSVTGTLRPGYSGVGAPILVPVAL